MCWDGWSVFICSTSPFAPPLFLTCSIDLSLIQFWLPDRADFPQALIMPPCELYQWAPAPSTLCCLIQSDPRLCPGRCCSHPIRYIEYVSQVFPLAYTPLERYHPSVLHSSTTFVVLKSSVKNALAKTQLWRGQMCPVHANSN